MPFLFQSSSNKSEQSSAPPPQFMAAYNNILNSAQGIAQQPLQQYSGDIVAGLSPDQQAAIQKIQDTQGIADPFFNQASDFYGQGAQQVGTNATQIARRAGQQANGIAGQAGAGATNAAGQGINMATSGAQGGADLATQGAQQGAAAAQQGAGINAMQAKQAANTDVWGQLPTFQSGINQYMSPYTQQVVNATQAQFDNQNAQDDERLKGNIVSAGAWGGDRAGVAQGIAAGQRALAQAPVIANLENQGFQQGTQEFNTQEALQANLGQQRAGLQASTALGAGNLLSSTGINSGQLLNSSGLGAGQLLSSTGINAGNLGANTALGAGNLGTNTALNAGNMGINAAGQQLGADENNAARSLQAAQGMQSLGIDAQNTSLQGADAMMKAGILEQNQQQAQLNVPYQQFLQQQAYPYQQLQWLASIATGTGSQAGGNSTTTSPGASPFSQIAGLGMAALPFFLARGGNVPRRAHGGGIGGSVDSSDIPDLSEDFIPDGTITHGGGPPKPPKVEKNEDLLADPKKMFDLGMGIKKVVSAHKGTTPGYDPSGYEGTDEDPEAGRIWGGIDTGPADSFGDFDSMSGAMGDFARGGSAGGSGGIKSAISMPHISTAPKQKTSLPANLTMDYGHAAADPDGKSTLPSTTYKPPVQYSVPQPTWGYNPDDYPTVRRGGGIKAYADGGSVFDDDEEADAGPDTDEGLPDTGIKTIPIDDQPDGAELNDPHDAAGIKRYTSSYKPRQVTDHSADDKREALKMGLLTAGLGMMASNKPGTFANIGAGGLAGAKTYMELRQQQKAQAEKETEAEDSGNYRGANLDMQAQKFGDEIDLRGKQLKQAGDRYLSTQQQAQQNYQEGVRHHKAQEAEMTKPNWVPSGVNKDGDLVYVNAHSKDPAKPETYVATGVKPKPSSAAGAQVSLSPAALNGLVIRKLKGEKVTDEIGNSAANKAAFQNAMADYVADPSHNVTPADVTAAMVDLTGEKAAARTLGSVQGRVESSVVEADLFANNALKANEKVNRTNFTPVNVAVQAWRNNTGNPDTIAFGFYNNSLANAYATAVGKGTKTVADTEEALRLLSTARSKDQYVALVGALKQEVHAAQVAPDTVRQRIKARISGKDPAAPSQAFDLSTAPLVPTNDSIDKLRAQPNLAPDFEKKYGPGSAARYLQKAP